MKARYSLLAVPLMLGVAFAQSSGSGSPAGSQSGAAATTSGSQTASQAGTTAGSASTSGKPNELKTMMYKGTLVDVGCGSSGAASTASTTPSTASTTASANRSTGESSNAAAGSGCPVSANTSQFGLKTDAGQTYRFDMVG